MARSALSKPVAEVSPSIDIHRLMAFDLDRTVTPPHDVARSEWLRGARRARRLATFSLAWLCFEGAATTTAGLLAGSTALVGNGLDGAVEGLASVIVVWRFTGSRIQSAHSERRAQQLVAVSFFLLAPYIAFEASRALLFEHRAETTILGMVLCIGTLCICPRLGRAKLRLGEQLGSAATAGEGRQNLICAYLAVAVLAGLLANTLLGVWWLDPTVALGIAALAITEGRRAWRGESCGCATCPVPPVM
jgi:divalent metal cation (Fe/Co/Zn/Cd) transporter